MRSYQTSTSSGKKKASSQVQSTDTGPSLWHAGIIALIIAVITLSTLELLQKHAYVKKLRNAALADYNAAVSMQHDVEDSLGILETSAGRERVLRDNFHVVKEGEEVIVFLPDTATANQDVDE